MVRRWPFWLISLMRIRTKPQEKVWQQIDDYMFIKWWSINIKRFISILMNCFFHSRCFFKLIFYCWFLLNSIFLSPSPLFGLRGRIDILVVFDWGTFFRQSSKGVCGSWCIIFGILGGRCWNLVIKNFKFDSLTSPSLQAIVCTGSKQKDDSNNSNDDGNSLTSNILGKQPELGVITEMTHLNYYWFILS